MRYLRWSFWIIVWIIVGGFFHYTLPQTDIARIVNTEVRREDFGSNSLFWARGDAGGAAGLTSRDVRFIEAFRANDQPMVYRNEDTGWGWPPYFKLDSSNLQAEARDLISTKDAPTWVAIKHYGWRSEWFSIYPNAVSVREVAGPDTRIIPWTSIVVLTLFAAIVTGLWVRWRRFREARIDPVIEDIGDGWDAVEDQVSDTRGRLRKWFDRLRGR